MLQFLHPGCGQIEGGYFFFNLDGTREQLLFLQDFAGGPIWLGVYTDDTSRPAQWKSVDGNVMEKDRLFWKPNSPEPNNDKGNEFYANARRSGLNDKPGDEQILFICHVVVN